MVTMSKRWSRDQELGLVNHLGVAGQAKLERKTGQSLKAIQAKAHRSFGTYSITRGTYSLREVARETGYIRTQLFRAQRALRQRWHRTKVGGRFMITLAQLDELVEWLRTDYWSARHALYGCVWCTTEDRPMHAAGLCARCYHNYRRRCAAAGLPTTQAGLLAHVKECLDGSGCDTLAAMVERLEGGLALTRRQLIDLAGR